MGLQTKGISTAKESSPKLKGNVQKRQKIQGLAEGLLECGWPGNDTGAITYSFNSNTSPKMSYGVLASDIVMLQNYVPMIL